MLQQHPLSAAFPAMSADDFASLVSDIRANGQRHDIVTFEGMVIDGWHRYRACRQLDITPRVAPLGSDVDPVAYVQSMNLHRRHLTGSQRAAAVVACSKWAPSGTNQANTGTGAPGSPVQTVAEMAKAADVSERTVQHAKKADEAGLGDAVRDGKVSAKQAAEVAKLPEPERAAALEAPAPKPAPAKPVEVEKLQERVEQLEAENAELKARSSELEDSLAEMLRFNEDTKEELEAAQRTLDAENLLEQFNKEIKRAHERARIAESRCTGLTVEVNELKGFAKMWKGKYERLEKATKKAEGLAA